MNKFQHFACGQIFHSYPQDKSFDEIIHLCLHDHDREEFNDSLEDTDNEDQQLNLCERYENEWWNLIPCLLQELAESAEYHFSSLVIKNVSHDLKNHAQQWVGETFTQDHAKTLEELADILEEGING